MALVNAMHPHTKRCVHSTQCVLFNERNFMHCIQGCLTCSNTP